MSFITDFNSILGTTTDAFKNIWTTVNAPGKLTIGSAPAAAAGTNPATAGGVGSALQKAAATSDSGAIIRNVLLGVAALVLALGLIVVRKK